jgi:hypothetical protein
MLSPFQVLKNAASIMIAMSIAILSCAQFANGEKLGAPVVDLGLRVVWGGNDLNSYVGEIIHEDGPLKVSHELSLDRSGTIRKSEQPNRVLVRDPDTRFGGCDLNVTGKLDSVLRLKFKPETNRSMPLSDSGEPLEMQLTLEQILSGPKELVLGSKSRVVIDRVPGDMLRVSHVRTSWVCGPGEALSLQITPHLTVQRSQAGTLDWELSADGESNSIQQGSVAVSLDDYGSSAAVSLGSINAPQKPGVYEIKIQLRPRRSLTQVFPASVAERRIQFVVVSSETKASRSDSENNRQRDASIVWDQSSVDREPLVRKALPVSIGPWGRVTSNFKKLTLNKDDDNNSRTISLGPRESLSLPIDDIQAFEPYLFSFSTESTMDGLELQFSEVYESGDDTKMRPISASKIQPTVGRLLGDSSDVQKENYSFRFTSSSPRAIVRITSVRVHGNITLNQFRIHQDDERHLAYPSYSETQHKDAPKIIEYMGADQWRSLLTRGRFQRGKSRYDTWVTITHALEDWLKLCKERGANCIAIPVLSAGSTLYPTERLLSNPLMNTGLFDSAARDPSVKDIVHWIYVLCDRYDLAFIPVFEWNNSLHSFKNLQIKEDMWGTQGGELAVGMGRWNPYQAEIQVEMKYVLKEFEGRYGHLKGYRGYAIHLGKTSNLTLAESIDQMSDPIINKLLSDQNGRIPNEMAERRIALSQLSGNAIYLKHQQALLSIIQEWKCDLAYLFTDVSPSVVDLEQNGPPVVYVHAQSPNLGPWIARRWWLEGFRPIAYQTDVMDAKVGTRNIIPANADWLTTAMPVESQALQRRVDRIRTWSSRDSTRAAVLNANPWECSVNLQWSVMPQNLRIDPVDCHLIEIEQAPSARIVTVPANQIVVLSWDNPNATLHTWGTDESLSLQAYQSALQRVESAVNLYSIPVGRSDLLLNSDFDQTWEGARGDLIPGWGNSINPNARISLRSDTPHSAPNHLRVECDKTGAAAWLQSSTFPLQSNRLQATMHYRVQPGNTMNLQWTLFIWSESNSRFDVVSRRSASVDFGKRTDHWGKWTEDFSEELASFGINESNTFRLQLDVQGDCTMDIDSVSIATDYLLERERIDFRNTLFLARRSLNDGTSEAVFRILDSTLVRTLLLWMKDADDTAVPSPANLSNSKADSPVAKQQQIPIPSESEKRSADRRWKFWNR